MIKKISILCPVYNEKNIAIKTLQYLYFLCEKNFDNFEICIVDDCSSDGTYEELRSFTQGKKKIIVKKHSMNHGIEKSLEYLYNLASGEWVINFSLDGEWDCNDIVRMTNYINTHPDIDLLVGKRTEKQYTLGRKIVSFVFNILPIFLYSVHTFDAGSMKLMQRKLLTSIPIVSHGVFAEAERIIRMSKLGYKIESIPVSHLQSKKQLKVIPSFVLIIEACIDSLRLWYSLHN